eukprot:1988162-Alexandrium_andersonii.AAC.1
MGAALAARTRARTCGGPESLAIRLAIGMARPKRACKTVAALTADVSRWAPKSLARRQTGTKAPKAGQTLRLRKRRPEDSVEKLSDLAGATLPPALWTERCVA